MAEVIVPDGSVHCAWDRSTPPAVLVDSGDVIHCRTQEVTGGQVTYGGPAGILAQLDRSRTYPLAGPIFVKDARPGDVLEVEMLELVPGSWGWTGILPDRGLLSDQFAAPYIRYFDVGSRGYAEFGCGIRIPLAPFPGTIGVVPDRPGPIPVRPPHEGGGNIDTRHLTSGTKLYLPVQVPGALLSVGDCHAAQGDGEVCVTGIECDMSLSLRVIVHRGPALRPFTYRFSVPRDPRGCGPQVAVSASGPDLLENARKAVLGVVEWLEREWTLTPEDAYILCSLTVDLHVSQIVNAPNYSVTALLPQAIFEPDAAPRG